LAIERRSNGARDSDATRFWVARGAGQLRFAVAPVRRIVRGVTLRVLLLCLALLPAARAATDDPIARAIVPPMKTSIYVGSVTLTTSEFRRDGDKFSATYDAKVFPWFFWSETGGITITVPATDLARLARGETVEFAGDAFNHKNKPRRVTGRAQPADAKSGKIKVRIHVDDVELIFNGPYRFEPTN
jgi:hypothetical protein